jgi:hypothetical protein
LGYSISWIAFQAKGESHVLPLMGFSNSGEADEANESPVSAAALPTGWYVVFFNDHLFPTPERLQKLSVGSVVVGCQVEEHVMASASFSYEDGRHIWTVIHESERGCYDLSADGDLPARFPELRGELFRQQAEAGGGNADVNFVFDVPIQLAAELCGYRHDRWKFDWGEPTFSRLEGPEDSI